MKRSENVGLMLMGGVAFAVTFAGGMAYMSLQRPSYAAQACTPAPNGAQTCQPAPRGLSYFFYPSYWRQQRIDDHEAAAAGGADRQQYVASCRNDRVGERNRALRFWIEREKLFPPLRGRLGHDLIRACTHKRAGVSAFGRKADVA